MTDTAAEPITLKAFDPADLLMDANAHRRRGIRHRRRRGQR